MALSTSTDAGITWKYYATLDNGTVTKKESSDTYPTVIISADQREMLTVWSTYCPGGTAMGKDADGGSVGDVKDQTCYATIKLGRTPAPHA